LSVAIDEELVRRLLAEQFPDLAPLCVRQVVPGGWDNRTFRIGDDLLARLPSATRYAAQVERERRWLPVLGAAGLPAPISRPIHAGAPGCGYPRPWSIYGWLPGLPLAEANLGASEELAAQLAVFLRALHQVRPDEAAAAGPANFHRGGDLGVYDHQMRRAVAALPGSIRSRVARIWDAAMESRWTGSPVWVHGDFAPRNLIVDPAGALAGVIDFGQVAIGDPACDLVIAWTYLTGPARRRFRERLDLDDGTWARTKGWAAWKAAILASGVAQGPRADVTSAEAVLAELLNEDGAGSS